MITRSPLWLQGGKCHGPKGPTTHFYMLPYHLRVYGLIHALSSKFAQVLQYLINTIELVRLSCIKKPYHIHSKL